MSNSGNTRRGRQPRLPLAQENTPNLRPEPAVQAVLVPSLQRHVTLTVSAKGIKTIDRIGIEAAIARIRRDQNVN